MTLHLVPISLAILQDGVRRWHRHSTAPIQTIAQVGVADGEQLVGVGCLERPKARGNCDGVTAEISRVATDGTRALYWSIPRTLWEASCLYTC